MASQPVGQESFSWNVPARKAPARSPRPERPPTGPRWLTADEATVHLGLPSRKALYAAVERGQVPAHRLGRRRLRFRLDELDSLLGPLPESTGVR